MSLSHTCDGCGATLGAREELHHESTPTGRSWYCGYCRMPIPDSIGERLSHRRDGSATDRRP